MNAWLVCFDGSFDRQVVRVYTHKTPFQPGRFALNFDFLEAFQHRSLAIVPPDRFTKDHAERHIVHQCLQRAGRALRAGKIGMHPAPLSAMPVAAIVALHSEAERITGKLGAIEHDLAGKLRVGMRRLGKADPAFVTEDHAEIRTIAQLPRNGMSLDVNIAPAGIFFDAIFGDSEMEG